MKVCLLYADRERATDASYYDPKSIIQDLWLESLFLVASKEMTYEDGAVKRSRRRIRFLLNHFGRS